MKAAEVEAFPGLKLEREKIKLKTFQIELASFAICWHLLELLANICSFESFRFLQNFTSSESFKRGRFLDIHDSLFRAQALTYASFQF